MIVATSGGAPVVKKILIVEDHADIRKLIRMTLELEDFEIHEAVDADSGLEALLALKPDLVLLDIMMPGDMDGLGLCRYIKAHEELKAAKVIMLTARGQAKDIEAGREAGSDAYLVKPFGCLHLMNTIESLFGKG